MKVYKNIFEQIISAENLFLAWEEFRRGKQSKYDVMKFEWQLEENLFALQRELSTGRYKHGSYSGFYITDPKQRLIHKAPVRDRILHHAIFNILNPIFEPTFIADSFSCRIGKGTHKGVRVLTKILRQASKNHTGPCYALKCDIYKFFASIDHQILMKILSRRINDDRLTELLKRIVSSFSTDRQIGKGLPIGNLTSQLFANVYMNEFDQFVKHGLKIKHYVRYTDDFIFVNKDVNYLEELLPKLQKFLSGSLALGLHPYKISIRKYTSGVDFLGYVILPHHIRLRTKTRRRLQRKLTKRAASYINGTISQESFNQTWQSYLGVLSHANSYKLIKELKENLRLQAGHCKDVPCKQKRSIELRDKIQI